MLTVNLQEKLAMFSEFWSPRIVGELNGQQVKLAKLKGEFVPHHHDNQDELFLVLKGKLEIRFPGKTSMLREGEFIIIPRGVEHQPVAEEETHVLLFEPAGTLNTGNVRSECTIKNPERI